jgi:hypothetical protein
MFKYVYVVPNYFTGLRVLCRIARIWPLSKDPKIFHKQNKYFRNPEFEKLLYYNNNNNSTETYDS